MEHHDGNATSSASKKASGNGVRGKGDRELSLWALRRQLSRMVQRRTCGEWLESDERDYQRLADHERQLLANTNRHQN